MPKAKEILRLVDRKEWNFVVNNTQRSFMQ